MSGERTTKVESPQTWNLSQLDELVAQNGLAYLFPGFLGTGDDQIRVTLDKLPLGSTHPKEFEIFVNHCGSPVGNREPLHGDIKLHALDDKLSTSAPILELLKRFNVTDTILAKPISANQEVMVIDVPPLPIILTPTHDLYIEMCRSLGIDPFKDISNYFDPRNRNGLYSFIHAMCDGVLPTTGVQFNYMNETDSPNPFSAAGYRDKMVDVAQRFTGTGTHSDGIDSALAYYEEHGVENWVMSLPKARTAIEALFTYQVYDTNTETTYHDFIALAQKIFPGYDVQNVPRNRTALFIPEDPLPRGFKFPIDGTPYMGSLWLNKSSGVCHRHMNEYERSKKIK